MKKNPISTDIRKKAEALKAFGAKAPAAVGGLAVSFFKDNFRKQGFDNGTVRPWPKGHKKKGKTLIKSGQGRRSIRILRIEKNAIYVGITTVRSHKGTTFNYMKMHNEGSLVYVRPHSRKKTGTKAYKFDGKKRYKKQQIQAYSYRMPRRQFIGDSKTLDKKVADFYVKNLRKILK